MQVGHSPNEWRCPHCGMPFLMPKPLAEVALGAHIATKHKREEFRKAAARIVPEATEK